MIRHVILSGTFLIIFSLFAACDDSGSSNNGNTPADGNGSCTATNNGEQYCYEVEEDYASFKFECNLFGGSWSASACDREPYARMCVEEIEVSEDDGATWTPVTYVYYFTAESTTGCLGDETEL